VHGAGPAGLTAGYLLAKEDRDVVVVESESQVGGLAKTVERDGYRGARRCDHRPDGGEGG
jgi:protoporphyrinogen oxidase